MRLPFLCVILFLVNTCENSKSVHPVELNQEFQLKFQEAAKLKAEDIAIRFTSLIQESRCPQEVHCITAGKAEIALQLGKGKEKTEQIQLSTEPPSNEVSYDKYRIKLLDVLPYPKAGEQNDAARYSVQLIISAN
jgi:hypothetical protein